ncbi:MAG: acetyl-CoA acetyltransferase [Acidimicrobiales bacterium]
MPLDPRTPILVGVGQLTRHPTTVDDISTPVELIAASARVAERDSGAALLGRVDSVQVVDVMVWRPPNAAFAVAEALGISPRELVTTTVGGNTPQTLVNEAALDILAGRRDVVLITGCEAVHSRRLAHKAGMRVEWNAQAAGTPAPDRVVGTDRSGLTDHEGARGLMMPVQVYPIFENAIRAAAGETVDEHQVGVSEMWSRFSAVAARNPHAWDRTFHTAEEIRTVTPRNRMVGWPYPKLMNSNIQVDMGAALLLTSVGTARAAGVPEDRWVFPWAGSDSTDHWFVSERWDLCSSPSIAANGRAALGAVGRSIDDVAHVDLYSCVPSAVQMGAAALGLPTDDPDRPLTVTGGLGFGGGPGNNYATGSIAAMAEVLRQDPGSVGLTTALGWYATKHSLGVWSTTPPENPFSHHHPQADIDGLRSRRAATDYAGPVTVESWTVLHERDGEPSLGIVAGLTPDGGRAWGNVRKPDALQALLADDPAGPTADLGEAGELELG